MWLAVVTYIKIFSEKYLAAIQNYFKTNTLLFLYSQFKNVDVCEEEGKKLWVYEFEFSQIYALLIE